MSVTFWVPDAKTWVERTPCDMPSCSPSERCGYCEAGIQEDWKSDAPDLNVANGNARILLAVLGLPSDDELYGVLDVAQIPAVRRQIVRALNTSLRAYAREAVFENRVYVQEFSEDRIRDRLLRLDAVLRYGQTHGLRVSWG